MNENIHTGWKETGFSGSTDEMSKEQTSRSFSCWIIKASFLCDVMKSRYAYTAVTCSFVGRVTARFSPNTWRKISSLLSQPMCQWWWHFSEASDLCHCVNVRMSRQMWFSHFTHAAARHIRREMISRFSATANAYLNDWEWGSLRCRINYLFSECREWEEIVLN